LFADLSIHRQYSQYRPGDFIDASYADKSNHLLITDLHTSGNSVLVIISSI